MPSVNPSLALPTAASMPIARVQPGAQQPDPSSTVGKSQPALTAASIPASLAEEARPTRGTLILPDAKQLQALDDATATSVNNAKKAKYFSGVVKLGKAIAEKLIKDPTDLGQKAKDLKFVDFAKTAKSLLGALSSVPLTISDARAQVSLSRQVANTEKVKQAFEAGTEQLATALKNNLPADKVAAARAELYCPKGAEQAQTWLMHQQASKQSNLLGLGLGVAWSATSTTEAGVTTAWEVTKKMGDAAASSLKNAIPITGIAGSVATMAISAHACKKAYAVRQELNAQRNDLAAARKNLAGSGTELDKALANVLKHAGDTLEIRNNANSMRAVGSAIGVAASGVSLAGNAAALTKVGIGLAFGLAVASATLSFLSAAATVGATIYEIVKGRADTDLKAAAAGTAEECAAIAGQNRFAALVVLADQLQTLSIDSEQFKTAESLLQTAGLGAAHVQAIITLARADGDISIHSLAVNELAKALYGAPVAPAAPAAQEETEPKVAMAVPATALRV
jgi:hypothetical protein